MAIPSKQIGWSQQSNLLWEISKQLDRTLSVLCTGPCPTTTTTTTLAPIYSFILAYGEGPIGACANLPGVDTFYTTSSVIAEFIFIYTDVALTIPAPFGWYAYDGIAYKSVEVPGQLQELSIPCA